jgi:hypothetical protein
MREKEDRYSATLYRAGGARGVPRAAPERVGPELVEGLRAIGEVEGGLADVFGTAGEEGADALSVEAFCDATGWRRGERMMLVRSPTTGNWYEHAFEWDPHPFVGWLPRERVARDPDGFAPLESGPFSPVGARAPDMRERVHAGVLYRARESGVQEEGFRGPLTVARALSREGRHALRKILEDGLAERAGGLEAPLGEILGRAKILGASVVRAEGPLGYPGERVKVFIRSRRHEGWARFPYVPPLSDGKRSAG